MSISMKVDDISISRLGLLHPAITAEATNIYYEILKTTGIQIRITSTFRSWEQQAILYAQGRTNKGKIVTFSKPGKSFHNYGLALDFCLLRENRIVSFDINEDFDGDKVRDWMEVVNVFKRLNWSWGGDFSDGKKDYPHFQKTFGLTLTQLLEYSKSGTIWNFDIPRIYKSPNKVLTSTLKLV